MAKFEGRYAGVGFGAIAGKASLGTGILSPINIVKLFDYQYDVE